MGAGAIGCFLGGALAASGTDVVFVGLIVIAILAFALSSGMRWLERRLVPWKGKI